MDAGSVVQQIGQLRDRHHDDQVEEQLQPGGVPLLDRVRLSR
jgi:hypothetical protein